MAHGRNVRQGSKAIHCGNGKRSRTRDGLQDRRLQVPRDSVGLKLAQRKQTLGSGDGVQHRLVQESGDGLIGIDCKVAKSVTECHAMVQFLRAGERQQFSAGFYRGGQRRKAAAHREAGIARLPR